MECCLTHNLACSQVTGLGHKTSAARVRRETQGTSTTVHGGGSVDDAEVPHMGTAALLTSLALCYQTLIVGILKDHTVEVSRADLSEAGYKGSKVVVFRLVQLIYVRLVVGNARVEVEVPGELKEVD
jgi:hypothetical protein